MSTSTKFKNASYNSPYIWFRPLSDNMSSYEAKEKLQELHDQYPPKEYLPNEFAFAMGCLELAQTAQKEHEEWLATDCNNPDIGKVSHNAVIYTLAGLEVFAEYGHGQLFDEMTPSYRSDEDKEKEKERVEQTKALLTYAGEIADALLADSSRELEDALRHWLPKAEAVARLGLMVVDSLSWCWSYPGTAMPASKLELIAEWNKRLAKVQRAMAQRYEARAKNATRMVEIRNSSLRQFRIVAANVLSNFLALVSTNESIGKEATPVVSYSAIAIPAISDGSFRGHTLHARFEAIVSLEPRFKNEKHPILIEPETLAQWFWNNCARKYPSPLADRPEEIIAYVNDLLQLMVKVNGKKFYLNEIRCNLWVSGDSETIHVISYQGLDYIDIDPSPIVLKPDSQTIEEMIDALPKNTEGIVDLEMRRQVHVYQDHANIQAPFFPTSLFRLIGIEAEGSMITHLIYEACRIPSIRMAKYIALYGSAANAETSIPTRIEVLVDGRPAPKPDVSF